VYDWELKPTDLDPALSHAWAGNVTGLRIAFASVGHIDLDWMSVYSGKAPNADGPSGPSAKVLNPDIEGGESLGPKLRGKEWDMTDPKDITHTYNVTGSAGGGVFDGTNAAPALNDPAVVFNLNCKTFKAADYHRFTVDMTYDGKFNVEDKVGGGMNQRVIWRVAGTPLDAGGKDLQNSDDLVIYPGRRRFTIDLQTNPPTAANDPDQAGLKLGWTGDIEMIRFDPNEDLGARHWQIHSMKLATDDMATAGTPFNIEWSDANFRPGGTATVSLSSSPDGTGATPIASGVAVGEGVNTTAWTADGAGSKWVVLTISRDGYESTSVSSGPITVGAFQPTFGINERGSDGIFADRDRCPGSQSAIVPGAPAPVAKSPIPTALALKPPKPSKAAKPAPATATGAAKPGAKPGAKPKNVKALAKAPKAIASKTPVN
jgi:hypothetical protein